MHFSRLRGSLDCSVTCWEGRYAKHIFVRHHEHGQEGWRHGRHQDTDSSISKHFPYVFEIGNRLHAALCPPLVFLTPPPAHIRVPPPVPTGDGIQGAFVDQNVTRIEEIRSYFSQISLFHRIRYRIISLHIYVYAYMCMQLLPLRI